MRGDFSRLALTGDGSIRVLQQQGRVLLDSDWNESVAQLVSAQREFAADLIGPYGGPTDDLGFAITAKDFKNEPDLAIGAGTYYVDGIRVVLPPNPNTADGSTWWSTQPYAPSLQKPALPDAPFLVYLDVWERHICASQDDSIREVALGGPDTTSQARLIWQVRVIGLDDGSPFSQVKCQSFPVPAWRSSLVGSQPQMRARVTPVDDDQPCLASPDAAYRGVENQLYRVEIAEPDAEGKPTFVWSRENGSVVASWLASDGNQITVGGVRDADRGFAPGDWIELTWDDLELAGVAGTRVQVQAVDGGTITLNITPPTAVISTDPTTLAHPIVRRWDGRTRLGSDFSAGVTSITESNGDGDWIALENGIEVQFSAPADGADPHRYHVGDYWTIPARVATGTIIWPPDAPDDTTAAVAPDGVTHHYAPLALFGVDASPTNLRRKFGALAKCS